MCLMANELFGNLTPDVFEVATAIELFHNFTLIHDDIMDKAPLRRGMQTVHTKYGESTALLGGDVMLIQAYEHLNKVRPLYIQKVLNLFNKTAKEVCEGQQLDMDFEQLTEVSMDDYIHMISLKTSVLIACSLQMGAILGGAGEGNSQHLYNFGLKLGIAFQVQDDYLDAFGDPAKVGKQVGGDILANKKTFLLIKALQTAKGEQAKALKNLLSNNSPEKINSVLGIFKQCGVDSWARELQQKYVQEAFAHLDNTAVLSARKAPIRQLAELLVNREY
jgi:geranylgeranyl diphosphate synthase, type II